MDTLHPIEGSESMLYKDVNNFIKHGTRYKWALVGYCKGNDTDPRVRAKYIVKMNTCHRIREQSPSCCYCPCAWYDLKGKRSSQLPEGH